MAANNKRSEAAKKAWDKRYRAMGIIPPRQRAKYDARAERVEQAREKTRDQLESEAAQHIIALLVAGKRRFNTEGVIERMTELTRRQLIAVPTYTIGDIVKRAKRKPRKSSGVNPFWYN